MKKILMIVLALFIAFQGAVLAAEIVGTVESVDQVANTLVIASAEGTSAVSYDAATQWPEGITDPNLLVDKDVKVTTDDATGKAVLVVESDALPEVTPDSVTQDSM